MQENDVYEPGPHFGNGPIMGRNAMRMDDTEERFEENALYSGGPPSGPSGGRPGGPVVRPSGGPSRGHPTNRPAESVVVFEENELYSPSGPPRGDAPPSYDEAIRS